MDVSSSIHEFIFNKANSQKSVDPNPNISVDAKESTDGTDKFNRPILKRPTFLADVDDLMKFEISESCVNGAQKVMPRNDC